jgi:hypothetical protein
MLRHRGAPPFAVRRDLGLTGALFAGTRAVLDGLFTTVLVLYFLLVGGAWRGAARAALLPRTRIEVG